jgi:PAS domain S-box-containing protein
MDRQAATMHANWPIGGGEMGERVRNFDWSTTPLGPVSQWPSHLRIKVNSIVNSPIPQVLMWGENPVMIYNDGYVEIAGGYHPRALGGKVSEIWPEIWDWNSKIMQAGFQGLVQSYRDQPMVLNRRGSPETVIFDLFYTPIYNEDGKVDGVLCTVLENTEKFEAQRALDESRSELIRLTNALPILVGFLDREFVYRFANQGYVDWFGLPPNEVIGRLAEDVIGKEYFDKRRPLIDRAMAGETVVTDSLILKPDGQRRHAEVRYTPRMSEAGEIDGIYVLIIDIDDRKQTEIRLEQQVRHRQRAEEQLHLLNETLEARVASEILERRQAEAKLQQAQKLETIGKLTGGVAHDFNNLLQVVAGNLQLLTKDVAGNEKAERRVSNALAGVSRGAKLASQLLAFGRRQALDPKVVNVGRFVKDMDDMLRRSIGEAVEIETVIAGGLWNSMVDPTQVENALLNLAINSRDAMEGNGKLTIEVGNAYLDDNYAKDHDDVVPGQYVVLAVTDTGTGIPPELLEQVFEPFFSTKEEGKGTGLGLSMVYGFVKQSGGHVKIYSEMGHGTTIKLYLPRAYEKEDREVVMQSGPVLGGNETILVVEDDDEVRETVVETLIDLGYKVLKAPNPDAALIVVEAGLQIDLLFTDVVMPGKLKSSELAKKAKERQPDIAVLFTSGYTENSIVHGGRLDAGVELLSKPYTREALARKIRHVLANREQRFRAAAPPPLPIPAPEPRMTERLSILLVEDDALIRMNTAEMIEEIGHAVIEAETATQAMSLLSSHSIEVLVTDLGLPDMSGQVLAAMALERQPDLAVVYATGHDRNSSELPEDAVVVTKPYGSADLERAISEAWGSRTSSSKSGATSDED